MFRLVSIWTLSAISIVIGSVIVSPSLDFGTTSVVASSSVSRAFGPPTRELRR